jgi:hypothetical protein
MVMVMVMVMVMGPTVPVASPERWTRFETSGDAVPCAVRPKPS